MPSSTILLSMYSWRCFARFGLTSGLAAEGNLGKPANIEASAKFSSCTGLLK